METNRNLEHKQTKCIVTVLLRLHTVCELVLSIEKIVLAIRSFMWVFLFLSNSYIQCSFLLLLLLLLLCFIFLLSISMHSFSILLFSLICIIWIYVLCSCSYIVFALFVSPECARCCHCIFFFSRSLSSFNLLPIVQLSVTIVDDFMYQFRSMLHSFSSLFLQIFLLYFFIFLFSHDSFFLFVRVLF